MKSIFAVLFVTISSVVFAANPTLDVKASSKASVFNIHYKSAEKGNVTVTIYDQKNMVVLAETLYDVASFVRPYNFENVQTGEYTIVIEGKNGKQVETIRYAKNTIQSFVTVAEVPNKENKFWLFAANNGMDTIAVRILAADGSVLHEQSLEVNGTFQTVYDLNKVNVASGVTFEVVDGNGKVFQSKF